MSQLLQINTAGAWHTVLMFPVERQAEVEFHGGILASIVDAKLRILDDENKVLEYWEKDRGWHQPYRVRRMGSDFLDQALNEGDGAYRP